MKYIDRPFCKTLLFSLFCHLLFIPQLTFSIADAAQKDTFDIIYILSKDMERVLDYKDELETIFNLDLFKQFTVDPIKIVTLSQSVKPVEVVDTD